MREANFYRLEYGSNALDFARESDLLAFAQEQGCVSVTYRPHWLVAVAS